MNFFFGFFPDQNTNFKIRKVVGEVGTVFNDFDIPVRWSKPDTYHMTLLFLGERFNFINNILFRFKLRDIKFKPFKIVFNTVKLGISRKYKELVYLDVKEGGENLRELYLELRKRLNINDEGNFVPHLTLGRISKDLSTQEYSNICKDLSVVTKGLNIKDIEFYVDNLYLIKSSDGNYKVLMNLLDLSKRIL
ncbi:MAG: 2'-5' RNA ligase family protein [Candidatus Dojkabacteria bacterium]|nr:2'-5' RNA ligase family protein [Candidatus Dojkabacteria bacterium]